MVQVGRCLLLNTDIVRRRRPHRVAAVHAVCISLLVLIQKGRQDGALEEEGIVPLLIRVFLIFVSDLLLIDVLDALKFKLLNHAG